MGNMCSPALLASDGVLAQCILYGLPGRAAGRGLQSHSEERQHAAISAVSRCAVLPLPDFTGDLKRKCNYT